MNFIQYTVPLSKPASNAIIPEVEFIDRLPMLVRHYVEYDEPSVCVENNDCCMLPLVRQRCDISLVGSINDVGYYRYLYSIVKK